MYKAETLTRLRSRSRVPDIESDPIVNDREVDTSRIAVQLHPYIVRLRVSRELVVDDYKQNRTTGSFILIDEASNETVGGGMIRETTV